MTTINAVRYIAITLLFLLAGCSHRVPQTTIEVIDTSLSITPRAEKAALDAVQDQIGHMQRGDRLVLIPITGDVQNDAGGHILRLSAPTQRETYDADLRRFEVSARKQFAAWVASLDQHQSRTDILGALDDARQEFASLPKEEKCRLIVVSDFLEDDGVHDFVRDRALATPARARVLAAYLRTERRFVLPDAALCLGRLESRDFAPLTEERKAAVEAFWAKYLSDKGKAPELHVDGTSLLTGNGVCSANMTSVSAN